MKNKTFVFPAMVFALVLLSGCQQSSGTKSEIDTPTSGRITVAVDESLQPAIQPQADSFENTYHEAKIDLTFLPGSKAIDLMLKDSARLAISTRKLTKDEMGMFDKLKITPHITRVALDGVAVILHPESKDTLFRMATLLDVLTGNIRDWKEIDKQRSGPIDIVFDNSSSSTVRYLSDSIMKGKNLFGKALKTNPDVIAYVKAHPNAMGIIGLAWISDGDDPKSLSFYKSIKVAGLAAENMPADIPYAQPFQAYLYQHIYPLTRSVYVISREPRSGLGTGFASYLAGNIGQTIFQKSGLLPAQAQISLNREVNLRNEYPATQ